MAWFVTVIEAPGITAPDVSVTVPEIRPELSCAKQAHIVMRWHIAARDNNFIFKTLTSLYAEAQLLGPPAAFGRIL